MQKSLSSIESFDDLEYPFETKKIKLDNDIELAYMDEGQGEPLILIHGLGSYSPAYKKNIEQLRNEYRVIAIDLPGYGKSTKKNYEYSMSFFANVVHDFMDKMNIEKASLVGHSMGGQISMMTALSYPESVDKLILIAPAGFETFTAGQKEWFRGVITKKGVMLTPVESIIANIGYNFYDMPEDAQFMIDDRIEMRTAKEFEGYAYANEKSVSGMVDEPVFDYLDQIKAPTLVIFGKNDNLIPNRFLNPGKTEAIAKQGAEKIPNSEMHIVSKAGHFVHFEKSEEVNQIISAFLYEK